MFHPNAQSPSAVHRVFRNPEILRRITAELAGADLRSLGMSCRALYEPSMDELWNTIPSLHCLLLCLPKEIVEVVPRYPLDWPIIRIKRSPTPEEWERVQHHARRVRVVKSTDRSVSRPSCRILEREYPDHKLFPNIRQCDLRGALASRELPLLVQPSLCVLRYRVDPLNIDTWRIDYILAGNASNLEVLGLGRTDCQCASEADFCVFDNPQAGVILSKAVLPFPRLASIHFSAMFDPDAILHLSQLPHLARLGIILDDTNSAPLVIQDGNLPFAALRVLKVEGQDATKISLWLGSLPFPSLTTLSVAISAAPSIAVVEELFDASAQFNGLTRLRISFGSDTSADLPGNTLSENILKPLLTRLLHIEEFSICGVPFNPTRASVVRIALAWSNLRTLEIHWNCQQDRVLSKISLLDLLVLTKHCPALEFVALPWSRTFPDPPWEIYQASDVEHGVILPTSSIFPEGVEDFSAIIARPSNTTLRTLQVSDSFDRQDSLRVAKLLGQNFPGVKITWCCPQPREIKAMACAEMIMTLIPRYHRR